MRRKTLMLNSMLALGAVAIVGFGITSLGAEGSETPTETLTEVQTGTVAQTVSATGNAVTPHAVIHTAFEASPAKRVRPSSTGSII